MMGETGREVQKTSIMYVYLDGVNVMAFRLRPYRMRHAIIWLMVTNVSKELAESILRVEDNFHVLK
jgi:hypothetical protein